MRVVSNLNLADLLDNPSKVSELSQEVIPALRGELAMLDTALLAHLIADSQAQAQPTVGGDQLLTVKEAASMLHVSTDYLYRNSKKLPFRVPMGRKVLFSQAGIERYIKQRMGR